MVRPAYSCLVVIWFPSMYLWKAPHTSGGTQEATKHAVCCTRSHIWCVCSAHMAPPNCRLPKLSGSVVRLLLDKSLHPQQPSAPWHLTSSTHYMHSKGFSCTHRWFPTCRLPKLSGSVVRLLLAKLLHPQQPSTPWHLTSSTHRMRSKGFSALTGGPPHAGCRSSLGAK